MINKWVHIECIFHTQWGLKILNEINNAIKENRMEKPSEAFNDYSMSIAIRLDLISRLLQRITQHLGGLNEYLKDVKEDYIYTQEKEGFALFIDCCR